MMIVILLAIIVAISLFTLFVFIDSHSRYNTSSRYKFLIPLAVIVGILNWIYISNIKYSPTETIINTHITQHYVNGHGVIQFVTYKAGNQVRFINCQDEFKRIIDEDIERVIIRKLEGTWSVGIYYEPRYSIETVKKEYKYNAKNKRYEYDPFDRVGENTEAGK